MGCDIHIEVFVKQNKEYTWVPKPPSWMYDGMDVVFWRYSWPAFRSYWVFGLLAGVRSANFTVKYPPRGLPEWLPTVVDLKGYYNDYSKTPLDVGDHTHSWLTLRELISIPWVELHRVYPDDYSTGELGWVMEDLVPMLEKLKSARITEDDIIVVFGFDS